LENIIIGETKLYNKKRLIINKINNKNIIKKEYLSIKHIIIKLNNKISNKKETT
jgi:hypothetical protein